MAPGRLTLLSTLVLSFIDLVVAYAAYAAYATYATALLFLVAACDCFMSISPEGSDSSMRIVVVVPEDLSLTTSRSLVLVPVWRARTLGLLPYVDTLLERGEGINLLSLGKTALIRAVEQNRRDLVCHLLRLRTGEQKIALRLATALQLDDPQAVSQGHHECALALREHAALTTEVCITKDEMRIEDHEETEPHTAAAAVTVPKRLEFMLECRYERRRLSFDDVF